MRLVGTKPVLAATVLVATSLPATAFGDIQHTVGKGHTIEAIAHRYHVPVKAIVEANHLTDQKHLRVGDVLTIPTADKGKPGAAEPRHKEASAKAAPSKDGKGDSRGTFAAKPKTPGVVHLRRAASTEQSDIRVTSKLAPAALRSVEKMLRSSGGASHPIEPRLIAMLGVVSNHFGSRTIEVVSGFRPFTPTQYNPHSNHNHGKAVDFRVLGVPNEVVRDFCRTLKNVGCGYYPNSTFVHMDVRETSAFWIDYSKPGEPPRYNAANVEADDATTDVHDEAPHLNAPNAAPREPTSEAPPTNGTEPSPASETPQGSPSSSSSTEN